MKTAKSEKWLMIALPLMGALFLATPLISARLDVNDYEGGSSRDVRARMERNSSSFAVMIGEFRTSMSDILFIKTERYLHGGVAYMPHMSTELLSVAGETAEIDHHQMEARGIEHDHHDHDHDHAGTPTVIRASDDDFRGFIGTLHRRVKPWMDPDEPHIHAEGTELLPWYRIMTITDPRNARAYAIGSWWLKSSDMDEAIAFADEGIRNNPNAFQIHNIRGRLFLSLAQDAVRERATPETAERNFREARASFLRASELGLARRPADYDPNGPDMPRWGNYDEDDLRNAVRMAVALTHDHVGPGEALDLARGYFRDIGGDPILRRRMHRIMEEIGNGETLP